MKINRKNEPLRFTPVTVEITFESQAELDALATLTNIPFVVGAVSRIYDVNLWTDFGSRLESLGGNATDKHSALKEAIKAGVR